MKTVELYVNDEYYCDLVFDEGYYKIPADKARELLLDDGDILKVQAVESW